MTALLNNRYRILKTLGRGGFGETYLTEDTHMPSRRKCVLKQLKPIVKQPKTPLWMKERFQREAAILEELGNASSQIPQLYAYFSENDKFYLVQEWIEGLTLDQYWEQEGNLHRDEVRQILLQLLPVLEYVHSRRIIHRDIKPENIILRRGDHLPFLIDFGAVKEAMATEVNQNSNSTYSASIGTPGYMSSEQAAGRPIYSSDLYSLGLTAIFLLTGKAPNELETDSQNGEIIWREHGFNLDPELATIIDRAIRFHPRDRFATAQEMLAALNNGVENNNLANRTGVTLNVAPKISHEATGFVGDYPSGTLRDRDFFPPKQKKSGWLTKAAWFLLIVTGVAVGTLGIGFAVVSSLLRSPSTPEAVEETQPKRQPDLFPPVAEEPNSETIKLEKAPKKQVSDKLKQTAQDAQESEQENQENPAPEAAEQPSSENKPPKTLAKIDLGTSEINIPILTTGTPESQLVSTLGQPNSERTGWLPNSKVLVYYDVVPDQVNLSYQSDDTGKIRQTDIALNQSISLGAMEQTLAKMLGGNASEDIRGKLRSVYNRQTNFSFFETQDLKGKVQRDAKDRINISVWDHEFQ